MRDRKEFRLGEYYSCREIRSLQTKLSPTKDMERTFNCSLTSNTVLVSIMFPQVLLGRGFTCEISAAGFVFLLGCQIKEHQVKWKSILPWIIKWTARNRADVIFILGVGHLLGSLEMSGNVHHVIFNLQSTDHNLFQRKCNPISETILCTL